MSDKLLGISDWVDEQYSATNDMLDDIRTGKLYEGQFEGILYRITFIANQAPTPSLKREYVKIAYSIDQLLPLEFCASLLSIAPDDFLNLFGDDYTLNSVVSCPTCDGVMIDDERDCCDECTLRSMPYDEYLKTEHWQNVRATALMRADNRCQLCNSPHQLHVHHRTYENRGRETSQDVIVLCKKCHAKFHNK